ncbi:MAG: prephenate dehydrogenase/arogenate dehydrogenase family protein, partial [Chloroflexota bacterium]
LQTEADALQNRAALAFAKSRSLIHREAAFAPALAAADLLILATPVRTILDHLNQLSHSAFIIHHSSFIIDLGSTKQEITSAMSKLPAHFDPLGGHPMCGKESGGITNADPDLFRGKTFALTPLERTTPRALALAHELISAIGAVPLILSAERHDELAAVTSHLPYLTAAALMRAAESFNDEQLWQMTASGFRDTTRLAASDLTMMIDILLTNRAAVLDALTHYRAELDSLAALIASADPD